MKTDEFREWLEKEGYERGTINSRISNCLRVCETEGDLDRLYSLDECKNLLSRLTYSTSDEKTRQNPKHNIPINGNVRAGTATLKQAVTLYIKFLTGVRSRPASMTDVELDKPASAHSLPIHTTMDSYSQFLDYFSIDKISFYSFGLENTIFADVEKIKPEWERIKCHLVTNQPLAIRGYGRQGKNTHLFSELYEFLFKNNKIYEDPTNNAQAKNNLQMITGHRINDTISNYQCSHIFGRTKNPLLFEAPWNMCFVPKIFDPLTGHESTGNWPDEYQELFLKMVRSKYRVFIEDYNKFVCENHIESRIEDFIETLYGKYDTKQLNRFRRDALKEWSLIIP